MPLGLSRTVSRGQTSTCGFANVAQDRRQLVDSRKVVIVTGGAEGIGWAMSKRFADEGNTVVVVDINPDALERRATELGGSHSTRVADVTSEEQVVALIETVKTRYGRIDVVINNAGLGPTHADTVDQTLEQFKQILDVSLVGAFLLSREAAKVMIKQKSGAIINMSSIAALYGLPRRNAYAAAKAGISIMTEGMACEWAKHGIRVNAIAPCFVYTDLVKRIVETGRLDMDKVRRRIPMGRLATPEDVANVASFLASPQASFVTGVTLRVDGGWGAFGDLGDASSDADGGGMAG
jgi:NAD(P)-dependent dehydrogenase (short-subunit alcohol dehydrogenase family)